MRFVSRIGEKMSELESFLKKEFPDLSKSQIVVMAYMISAFETDPDSYPTIDEISSKTGMGKEVVQKDIAYLHKMGYITYNPSVISVFSEEDESLFLDKDSGYMMHRDKDGKQEFFVFPEDLFETYIKGREDEEVISFVADFMSCPEEFVAEYE